MDTADLAREVDLYCSPKSRLAPFAVEGKSLMILMRDDGREPKYRHATRLQGNDATLSTQNAKLNKIEIAGGLDTNRFPA